MTIQISRRGFGFGAALAAAALASRPAHALARVAPGGPGGPGGPAPRAAFGAAEIETASVPGIPNARFHADSPADYLAALGDGDAVRDNPWLVLSGGGENGAYGAGLLAGWTATGERPRFGVVTGISTGALIAPFAFAGPAYDDGLRACYTGISAADIFEFGSTPESLLDTWPLSRLIEKHVTAAFLREVAAGHREGRRLFILTTNVDTQRAVAWNMGAIAAQGDEAALKLFRSILLASSSIPGVFPPVYLDVETRGRRVTEMHVDGGVTTPFYLAPEEMVAAGTTKLPARQVYVIVNNLLDPEFQVTPKSTLTVLGRSLSAAVKAATRAALVGHRAFARRTGLQLMTASIPAGTGLTAPGPFDGAYMKALFAYAERAGRSGSAFDGERRTPSSPATPAEAPRARRSSAKAPRAPASAMGGAHLDCPAFRVACCTGAEEGSVGGWRWATQRGRRSWRGAASSPWPRERSRAPPS